MREYHEEYEEYEEMDGLGISVGDFIHVKGIEGALFIVSDVYDYTDYGDDDSDLEIAYEAIKIFPVSNKSNRVEFDYSEVLIHSKMNSDKYKITYETIKRLRYERGLKKEPDFMEDFVVADRNVDYSSAETFDDCLDMMNNLDFLYETFGDKEYKENKEFVLKRLEELVKDNNKKKK